MISNLVFVACLVAGAFAWPYDRSFNDYDYPQQGGGYARPSGGYQRPSYSRPDQFQIQPEASSGYARPNGGYGRPSGGYGRPANADPSYSPQSPPTYPNQPIPDNTGFAQNPQPNPPASGANWDHNVANPTTFGDRFGSADNANTNQGGSQWSGVQTPVAPADKVAEGVVTMNGNSNGNLNTADIDTTGTRTFGSSASSSDQPSDSESTGQESTQPSTGLFGGAAPMAGVAIQPDTVPESTSGANIGSEVSLNNGGGIIAPDTPLQPSAGANIGSEVTINPAQTADGALVLG